VQFHDKTSFTSIRAGPAGYDCPRAVSLVPDLLHQLACECSAASSFESNRRRAGEEAGSVFVFPLVNRSS
jgi:hypothetical protein